MRKKGLFVAVLMLLLFGGCDSATQSEEWALPTLAPEVVEQEDTTSADKDEEEDDYEEKETGDGENTEEEISGGMYSDFMSYIDNSKQARDRNQADAVEIVVEAACLEAKIQGMVFPTEPIRFRYTNELDQLDASYALLKDAIRDLMGDDVIELKVEGNYMMVEISADESGNPKVNVELLQE